MISSTHKMSLVKVNQNVVWTEGRQGESQDHKMSRKTHRK